MGVFEEAVDLVSHQLARAQTGFDDLDAEPTENDRLLAGHIVGNLWANKLLNTGDEKWTVVDSLETRHVLETTLNDLARECHAANQTWWRDPATGERLDRNKGELLMLIVSEISEAMEGERKDLMDDKLPHRKMVEVELADALIRIFDYAGAFGYDLDGAVAEKRAFNAWRPDHKPEHRLAANGKRW